MYIGEIVRAMGLYGYKYKALYESEYLDESLDDTVYRLAFEDLYEAIGILSAELETCVDTKESVMSNCEVFDPDLAYETQCEDREFNKEEECEYWYMNLKNRDFIERDSAAMNSNNLPF